MNPLVLVPGVPSDPDDRPDPRDPRLYRPGLAEARAALADANHRRHEREVAERDAAARERATRLAQEAALDRALFGERDR